MKGEGIGGRRRRSVRADAYAIALGRGVKTVEGGHLVTCEKAKRPKVTCNCGRDQWSR